jgi:hypothetical protein
LKELYPLHGHNADLSQWTAAQGAREIAAVGDNHQMQSADRPELIISLTPAPGFYTVMVDPDTDGPVEFWPLVGWALIERDYREDPDEPPNIDRQVEGMIAIGDAVVRCQDRHLDADTPYLFVGYDNGEKPDPSIWQEEATRVRGYRRSKEAKTPG